MRWAATGQLGTGYLSRLSADAVPVLVDLPESVRACALHRIADDVARPDGWRDTNLSRAAAREALAGVDVACKYR